MSAIEPVRVGIPRALLYYWFSPVWEAFLGGLGASAVISPPTNKALLNLGLTAALDEVCLPVKLFLGHVAYLSRVCDVVFVPHLVSLEEKAFTCPKFMGLPDLVRMALPGVRTIEGRVDLRAGLAWETAMRKVAAVLGYRGRVVERAWQQAVASQSAFGDGNRPALPLPADDGGLTLAVLGHPYCLYDRFLNMNLLERLAAAGCRPVTPEMLPASAIEKALKTLPKPLFWSFGRRQLGALFHLAAGHRCAGVVHLSAFACGPEALVGELIQNGAARHGLPLLRLHLDEHTGEAGFLTRVEAFLDMIARRARCE